MSDQLFKNALLHPFRYDTVNRKGYWITLIFSYILGLALVYLTRLGIWAVLPAGTDRSVDFSLLPQGTKIWVILMSALLVVLTLYFLCVTLGISVRRLHDAGYSGWWVLAYYLVNYLSAFGVVFLLKQPVAAAITSMVIGTLFVILLGSLPSKVVNNRYREKAIQCASKRLEKI
ncbi:MAG: DUF805 domain-containing protein [Neisseriaceae bacterium]